MGPIRTLGHGTLEPDQFTELVRGAGIAEVVDIRRYPGSRRYPHFAREAMARWLPEGGLAYRWMEQLGGRRKPDPTSLNLGLRNDQFRAYADHMDTELFRSGVRDLLDLANQLPVAVMCSESVWWRCHRRLLADHLVLVEGVAVEHLFHDGRLAEHPVTAEARLDDGHVAYLPGGQPTML